MLVMKGQFNTAMGTVQPPNTTFSEISHFVRVIERNHRGNVEFQFSIGDPSLYLEMTLPLAAFEDFCREHEVCVLSDEQAREVDANERRWRFGDVEED